MASKRILVVDDEPTIRALLLQMLAIEGYLVECAADGREALERINTNPPDLVLLDIMMPVMDGWEVLERLRGLPEAPLVVVVSAYVDPCQAVQAGAAACFPKPFVLRQLLETCRRLLAESGGLSESNCTSGERRRA